MTISFANFITIFIYSKDNNLIYYFLRVQFYDRQLDIKEIEKNSGAF
jgi:hypothetical protein